MTRLKKMAGKSASVESTSKPVSHPMPKKGIPTEEMDDNADDLDDMDMDDMDMDYDKGLNFDDDTDDEEDDDY